MPAADLIMITAGLQAAPLWAPIEIAGLDFGSALLHLPERLDAQGNPYLRGLLVLLHDAGQGRDYWMRSPEARLILRAAAARDFGILVPESLDRRSGWSLDAGDPAANADIARLSAAIAAVPREHWQGNPLPTILLRSPDELPWREALDGLGLGADLLVQVRSQLDLTYAEHQLNGHQMHQTLDFFDRRLSEPGPVRTPGTPTVRPSETPTTEPTVLTSTPSPSPDRPPGDALLYLPSLER